MRGRSGLKTLALRAMTVLSLGALLLGSIPGSVAAEEGLTRAQGDAILKELRAIHQLLQSQRQPARPQPQRPKRAKVPVGDGTVLGSADAPVTMVEFTDYQCPFCKRFYDQTFGELKKAYIDTGKVRFVSRNLPLSIHQNANGAARAALCAGEQGHYWEMRQLLFANNRQLAAAQLPKYAAQLKLDGAAFQACLDGPKVAAELNQDHKDASAAGITGTPSFVLGTSDGKVVDGDLLVGAQPFVAFKGRIETLLRSAGGHAQ